MGSAPVTGYLLDTHVWFWYLLGRDELAGSARKVIDGSVEKCWLSPISVWEVGILHQRGKIQLGKELRQWVEEAGRKLPLQPAPFSEEISLATFEIDLSHADPADRFLVATALVYGLTLLTADRRLLASSSVETIAARSKRR